MRHTDTFEVIIKVTGLKPQTFMLPLACHVEVKKLLRNLQGVSNDSIPAEDILPEIFDLIKGPATCLRGMRYREGLTQKQLADKLGISQRHLSEMENCKRPIGKAMAKKLAEALNANWRLFL